MKTIMRVSVSLILSIFLVSNVCAMSVAQAAKNKKYRQWVIGTNKSGNIYTKRHWRGSKKNTYNIKGLAYRRFLHYEKQGWAGGINLGWTNNLSAKTAVKRSRWYFTRRGRRNKPVVYGEILAIAWGKAGYIKYGKRKRGINLKWSKRPVYQWKILGGKKGTRVRLRRDRVVIYNTRNKQPLIYFKRRYAGNIGWANSKSFSIGRAAKNAGKKVVGGAKAVGGAIKQGVVGAKHRLRKLNARRKKCRKRKDRCTNCNPPKANVDRDRDGVPDLLEYRLAHKFFPRVIVYGKIFDMHQFYHYRGYSTPFTVKPFKKGPCAGQMKCLEIRMGITFLMDGGAFRGAFGHIGDGEMYMAIVRRIGSWQQARKDAGRWVLITDFATAHWRQKKFGISSDYSKSKIYRPGRRSRVTIHAAKRKHALYHSRRACEAGTFRVEKCPGKGHDMLRYKGRKLQNIGSRKRHAGMDVTMAHPVCGSYPVWSNRKFGEDVKVREYFEWSRVPYRFR